MVTWWRFFSSLFFFFFLHNSELIAIGCDTKLGEQTLTVMPGKLSFWWFDLSQHSWIKQKLERKKRKKYKIVKALQMLSGSHAFNEDLTHGLKVCGRWRTSALNNLDFTLSALLLYNLNLTSWMETVSFPLLGRVRTVTFTVVFVSAVLLCLFSLKAVFQCQTSPRNTYPRRGGSSQVRDPLFAFR